MRVVIKVAALAACSAVSACQSTGSAPPVTRAAVVPAAYSVDKFIGRWGVASFRDEKDRQRTEAQARAQCKLPYVITKGPSDGIMMHVADDPTLHELTVKGGAGGKTYLGFDAPPGDDQDREVLSVTDNMFVARFVNPDIATRYGTFIYIRCPR